METSFNELLFIPCVHPFETNHGAVSIAAARSGQQPSVGTFACHGRCI
jgi:hypothetical protein